MMNEQGQNCGFSAAKEKRREEKRDGMTKFLIGSLVVFWSLKDFSVQ